MPEGGEDELGAALTLPAYPRATRWPARWMLDNVMGPNPVWLAEAIAPSLALTPGMRVLDLGCGRAIVVDLPRRRVRRPGLGGRPVDRGGRAISRASVPPAARTTSSRCTPRRTRFRSPSGYFDAIVSLDAYHYFGTDDLYVGYREPLPATRGAARHRVSGPDAGDRGAARSACVRSGNGSSAPSTAPTGGGGTGRRRGSLAVEMADMIPEGWRHWLTWSDVCATVGTGLPGAAAREAEMLRADAGRLLGLVRIVGRRLGPHEADPRLWRLALVGHRAGDTRSGSRSTCAGRGVLEHTLAAEGVSVRVIEDCLNGRRTVWDDPFKPGRNGAEGLAQRIEINSPLALVVLLLGTNDFQSMHTNVAWHSAQGVAALVRDIRGAPIEPGMPVPPVLVVAPPPIGEPKGAIAPKFEGGDRRCAGVAAAYREVADRARLPLLRCGNGRWAEPCRRRAPRRRRRTSRSAMRSPAVVRPLIA